MGTSVKTNSKNRMANTPNDDVREGHGDDSYVPSISKGTFIDGGGTYESLNHSPMSVNRKSGGPSGTEAGGVSSGPAFGR
jgi:hypothetical protein